MIDVVLIYPFTKPKLDRSRFRLPPLGLGYIASYLREENFSVEILDCTFKGETKVIQEAIHLDPRIIGIYSMYTMKEASNRLADQLRPHCDLIVVGGPLPSVDPEPFLDHFDIVAIGEGEKTMLDIVRASDLGSIKEIKGIMYRKNGVKILRSSEKGGEVIHNPHREFIPNLDDTPRPARDLFDNQSYVQYYIDKNIEPTTSIMTSRGCPFNCDFCSKPVFGSSLRLTNPDSIIDEVKESLNYGYRRVYFQDDCFTISKERLENFCHKIIEEGIEFEWECLSRVDGLDAEIAGLMKKSGCKRIYFGLESGNDKVLKIMNKKTTADLGRKAVEAANLAGLETGAFFILGYPGETDETILETIEFAVNLPLDYLSFSLPYPIPGTGLYEKTERKLKDKNEPEHHLFIDHELVYESEISERKLKFAITKAMTQYYLKKKMGKAAFVIEVPFNLITEHVFRLLK